MTATTASDPAGTRFDRRLLAPMMLGSILNPVNSTIIAVALVPIAVALGASASATAWLISGLYLATSIGQPVVGRLVDTFGPRRLFLLGTGLTGVAGVIGMLAPDLAVLVLARVLLGLGTCAGYPASMYLIRSEARRTGQDRPAGVLTALAVVTQTIAVVGPSLGGLLIDLGGWRATFAVNVPLAVAGLVLGALFLPKNPPLAEGRTRRPRLDAAGILLFAATLVSLLLFLMDPHALFLMDPHAALLWLLGIAVAAATAFALRERSTSEPFIDVRVLAGNRPLLGTYARSLVAYTVSYAFIYGYTQWLESGRGLSASATGLLLLPTFAVGILVSATTGRRGQVRAKLIVGAAAQVVACVLLLLVSPHAPVGFLVVVAVIMGVPQGLISLGNQNALYHQADAERIGASAGLLRTFTYLGAIVASAATGAFFGARADTDGMHRLAAFMLASSVLFAALSLADRSLGRVGRVEGST